MKIRYKLILSFLLVASLASITTFFTLRSYQRIDAAFEQMVSDPVWTIQALENLKHAGLGVIAVTNELALRRGAIAGKTQAATDDGARLAKSYEAYRGMFREYGRLVARDPYEQTEYFPRIQAAGERLLTLSTELSALQQQGAGDAELAAKKKEFQVAEEAYFQMLNAALHNEYTELIATQREVRTSIAHGARRTLFITGLIFLAALAAGMYIARNLARRLGTLRRFAEQVGQGELKTRIDSTAKDEIGDLARAFNRMVKELHASRTALAAEKNFTHRVMDSMVDFVVVTDLDLKIRRVNRATTRLSGYAEDELVGQSVNMLMADRPFNEKGIGLLRRQGTVNNLFKQNLNKDGSTTPISMSMAILKDDADNDTGIICVGKDITQSVLAQEELERFNQKLQQSNRELQEFAYIASHDLQEPLRKVQAFADRLTRKYAPLLEGEGLDYLARMKNAGARMQILIEDLLKFSRVTTKAQPFAPVNLNKITQEVLSDLEVNIEETHARIEVGALPQVEADAVQMRQLMQNLIGNALKFRRPEIAPRIEIFARPATLPVSGYSSGEFTVARISGEFAPYSHGKGHSNGNGQSGPGAYELVVRDNGIGFDEKYLDKIFTVFQRLHGRSEYEGSGIGLAVCRKIVERHSGTLTAASAPGEGASFFITLPVRQTARPQESYA